MTLPRRITLTLYGLAAASALLWLLVGLGPALAAASPGLHDRLHEAGESGGRFAALAAGIANSAHGSETGWQVVFDYLFSLLNLAVGIFILRLRPNERAARLLALGMIGSAVAFNLQAHDAMAAIPASFLSPLKLWHDMVHIVAGLAYVYALLLFPAGRLPRGKDRLFRIGRIPLIALATLFVLAAAGGSTDEHTVGLVVLFGIVTPAVGIGSQIFRARSAPDRAERQQSRVVVKILLVAVAVAAPLMLWSAPPTGTGPPSETRRYEFTSPAPGRYFFLCDPHPEDMRGSFVAVSPERSDGADRSHIDISSFKSRFDVDRLVVPAGERITIDFTNLDADLHNVAVYRDAEFTDPIFIGAQFSGHVTGQVAFRTFRTLFAAIPIALFAVLIRFRLWDIDKVVSRTLIYGALAALIGGAYVAIVTLLGEALGGARLHPLAYVVSTGAVALAVQPLRARAEGWADRLVYGPRASPYQLMARLARDMAVGTSLENVLPRLAEAAARGTGSRSASVRVFLPGDGERHEQWPSAAPPEQPTQTIPVLHRGERIGELGIRGGRDRHGFLHDLASHAELALQNVRLAAELHNRVEEISRQAHELRASRRRIVAAQDAERRRLERDIHDGAQQQLVALKVRLRLVPSALQNAPEKAEEALKGVLALTGEAIETLRALAGGLFPPLLEDRGLVAALEAEVRRAGGEVVADDGLRTDHLDTGVEQAVYFACLEALQNATKHASAARITVSLAREGDEIHFRVEDDGRGFNVDAQPQGSGMQNMVDRIAALGGTVDVTSRPGGGTTVGGRVPLQTPLDPHASASASGPNSAFGR